MARAVLWAITLALAATVLTLTVGSTPAMADPRPPARIDPPDALCLACHRNEGLSVQEDGEERALAAVRAKTLKASAHSKHTCVSCHREQSVIPHDLQDAVRTEDRNAGCARCHAGAYEGFLHSPHGTMVRLEDRRAPACTSCHGEAHQVQPLDEWSSDERAAACGECHDGAGPSFLNALSHEEPSASFRPIPYFAGRFLILLTAGVLAFGIIHVELDILRWLASHRGKRSDGDS